MDKYLQFLLGVTTTMTTPLKLSNRFDKSTSDIVLSVAKVAEIYGKTRPWARAIMKAWLQEQHKGGPVRIIVKGKKNALYTTLAVLQREMPPPRDQLLVRKIEEIEKAIAFNGRQIQQLLTDVGVLQRIMMVTKRTG